MADDRYDAYGYAGDENKSSHENGNESSSGSESEESGSEEEDPRDRHRFASSAAAASHEQLSSVTVSSSKRARGEDSPKRYHTAKEHPAPAKPRSSGGKKRANIENNGIYSLGRGKGPIKGDVPIDAEHIKPGLIFEAQHGWCGFEGGWWEVKTAPLDEDGHPNFKPAPLVPDKNKRDQLKPDESKLRFDEHALDCIKVQDNKATPYPDEVYEKEPKLLQHFALGRNGKFYRIAESSGRHAMDNFVKEKHSEFPTWLEYVKAKKWKENDNRFPNGQTIGVWASLHQRNKKKTNEGASPHAADEGSKRRAAPNPVRAVPIKDKADAFLKTSVTKWIAKRAPDSQVKLDAIAMQIESTWQKNLNRILEGGQTDVTHAEVLKQFYLSQVAPGRVMFRSFIDRYKKEHHLDQEEEEEVDLRMEVSSGDEEEEDSKKKKKKKHKKSKKKKKEKKSKKKSKKHDSEEEEEESEHEEEEAPKRKKHKKEEAEAESEAEE